MKLELRGLTKRFGSLVANDHIDLVVEPGEIHCLLGENGAGKSTLMNLLYGLLQPDEGEILLDDEPLAVHSPGDAIRAGIGMVHQHFMLVPVFSVAENIMLGRERTKALGVLDQSGARKLVRELSERYSLAVDPDKLVEDLPVGIQQRVEILKALANDAKVLILDEPTAVLTPQEIDELIGVMRAIAENGTSIIFITHKLKEVKAIADRITVIRRGKVIDTVEPSASESDLAELMVGRAVDLVVDKDPADPQDPKLVVDGLTIVDAAGHIVVDDVSFDVKAGEIVGIAGVQGNGQSELVRALVGLETPVKGSIGLGGVELVGRTPREHLEAGIGYVPEDRSLDGYVGSFSVAENLVLDLIRRPEFSRGGVLSLSAVQKNADHRVEEFDVRTQSTDEPVSSLSGGNQQKVVLARELSRPLELLIAGQPTRGLDVGSIEFVHSRIVRERDQGTAVLIVSTELDEISALSDRIIVMFGGRIVGTVGPDAPRDQLGLMMAGASVEQAAHEAEENPTALAAVDRAVEAEHEQEQAQAARTRDGEAGREAGAEQARQEAEEDPPASAAAGGVAEAGQQEQAARTGDGETGRKTETAPEGQPAASAAAIPDVEAGKLEQAARTGDGEPGRETGAEQARQEAEEDPPASAAADRAAEAGQQEQAAQTGNSEAGHETGTEQARQEADAHPTAAADGAGEAGQQEQAARTGDGETGRKTETAAEGQPPASAAAGGAAEAGQQEQAMRTHDREAGRDTEPGQTRQEGEGRLDEQG